jgi:hypothetical protein
MKNVKIAQKNVKSSTITKYRKNTREKSDVFYKSNGELYLANVAEYYNEQRAKYTNYVDFERESIKRFLETTSPAIQAKFPSLCTL